MTLFRPTAVRIALVLTLGAWLAACSGAPRADAVSAAATTGDTASAIGGTKASCKQLTKEQVQPLLVNTITDVKVTAAGTDAIDVLVLGGVDAQPAYASAVKGESHGAVAVPGVGDQASRDTGDGEIDSIKGDLYCAVSLGSSGDVPGIGKLEQAAGGTT